MSNQGENVSDSRDLETLSGPAAPAGRPRFTVVVPVFNEEGNLAELHRRLTAVFGRLDEPYELLFVDDGSTDRSLEVLARLHADDPSVRVLSFSRNFGHHLAVTAGMAIPV